MDAKSKKLTVHHPVNHLCPEVAETEALRLIAELEEIRVRQLYAATCELEKKLEKVELKLSWWEHLSELVKMGGQVELPGLPSDGSLSRRPLQPRPLLDGRVDPERKEGWMVAAEGNAMVKEEASCSFPE